MGVLNDNFAAVDFLEELCYHSQPKEAKFKRNDQREKLMKESCARWKKRQPIGNDSTGESPLRRAFSLIFHTVPFRGIACLDACARVFSRLCIIVHATVPKVFSFCYRPL